MSPEWATVVIAGSGVLISWVGSAFIAGARWGSVKTRLEILDVQVSTMATKDQLSGLKEDVAEIKGMFRMVPKASSDGA